LNAARPVRYAISAKIDLADIWEYTAQSSEVGADRLIERITNACDKLGRWPHSGRPFPTAGRGIRALPESNRIILYHVLPDAVEIVHVFHGAMNIPRAMRRFR
jgi:toxin ParE1/3/4